MNDRLATFAIVFGTAGLVIGLMHYPIGTLLGAGAGVAITLGCGARRMTAKNQARLAFALASLGVGFQLLATPARMALGLVCAFVLAHAAGWLGDDA